MTFEANIKLATIPSTIKRQSDGSYNVQLKLDGIMTAKSHDGDLGLSDEEIQTMVANGDIEVVLVNRSASK